MCPPYASQVLGFVPWASHGKKIKIKIKRLKKPPILIGQDKGCANFRGKPPFQSNETTVKRRSVKIVGLPTSGYGFCVWLNAYDVWKNVDKPVKCFVLSRENLRSF